MNILKNIIFLVDTSGSLYSNKISAVNDAIFESVGIIRRKIDEGADIDVYYSNFDEEMEPIKKVNDISNDNLPDFKTVENNGFYKLTYFSKLYEGLLNFLECGEYAAGEFLIVLITDGKAIDSMKYEATFNKIKNVSEFRNATRLVAFVEGNRVNATPDLFGFVDNNANRIVELTRLANEIDNLIITDSGNNFSNIFT